MFLDRHRREDLNHRARRAAARRGGSGAARGGAARRAPSVGRRPAINPSPATKFLIGRGEPRPFCLMMAWSPPGGSRLGPAYCRRSGALVQGSSWIAPRHERRETTPGVLYVWTRCEFANGERSLRAPSNRKAGHRRSLVVRLVDRDGARADAALTAGVGADIKLEISFPPGTAIARRDQRSPNRRLASEQFPR